MSAVILGDDQGSRNRDRNCGLDAEAPVSDEIPVDHKANSILLETLTAQLTRNEEMVRSILTSWDRLFALGLLVFTGGLTLGLEKDRREVLLFLPAAILIVLLLGYNLLFEMVCRGGYSRYLEERINSLISKVSPSEGRAIALWEGTISPRLLHRSLNARFFLPAMYWLFFVASWSLSIGSAITTERLTHWLWLLVPAAPLSVAMLVLAMKDAATGNENAYQAAVEADSLTSPSARS
jgi:hypothetical protein